MNAQQSDTDSPSTRSVIVDQNSSSPAPNSEDESDETSESDSSTEDDDESQKKEWDGALQSQRQLNGVVLPTIDPSSFGNVNVEGSSKVQVGSSSSHIYNGTVKIRQVIYTNTEVSHDNKFRGCDLSVENDSKLGSDGSENLKNKKYRLKGENDDQPSDLSKNCLLRAYLRFKRKFFKSRQQKFSIFGAVLTLLLLLTITLLILAFKNKDDVNNSDYKTTTPSSSSFQTTDTTLISTSTSSTEAGSSSSSESSTNPTIPTSSSTSTALPPRKTSLNVTVFPLRPEGIKFSFPDDKKGRITLVTFHAKRNDKFSGNEYGNMPTFDLTRPKNGLWVFYDEKFCLDMNDIVYYWVHTVYDGEYKDYTDYEHKVTDFYDIQGNKINSTLKCPDISNNSPSDTLNMSTGTEDSKKRDCISYSITKLYNLNGNITEKVCEKELIFEDHFQNFDQFVKNNWSIVERFSDSPAYEFNVYKQSNDNLNVDNGLKITPKLMREVYDEDFIRQGDLSLTRCIDLSNKNLCQRVAQGYMILPPATSGRINTRNFLNFEYGRVQIRAKFPKGDWIYPLLMLEPSRPHDKNLIREIHIASAAGNIFLEANDGTDISGRHLKGDIIFDFKDKFIKIKSKKISPNLWSDNFHIYELIWKPHQIFFKVDGKIYGEPYVNIPSESPFFLTLGLAVGGAMEFPDFCYNHDYVKPWKNHETKDLFNFYLSTDIWSKTWHNNSTSLIVDYVKVWAL